MKNQNTLGWIILAVVVGGLLYGAYSIFKPKVASTSMDSFAQCVASKKVTMYGAEWCSHCKKEKSNFGSSFKYIPYVECPKNEQLCLEKGISGYPTWIAGDGRIYQGEQGLEGVAKISECPLPIN